MTRDDDPDFEPQRPGEPFRRAKPHVAAYLTATRMQRFTVRIRQAGPMVKPGQEEVTIVSRAESKEQLLAMLSLQAMAYQLTKFEVLSIRGEGEVN